MIKPVVNMHVDMMWRGYLVEIKIGRLLKEQRQKYKLELKDVSRGLCAERSLNRYESDERFPDKMLADRLFGRIASCIIQSVESK